MANVIGCELKIHGKFEDVKEVFNHIEIDEENNMIDFNKYTNTDEEYSDHWAYDVVQRDKNSMRFSTKFSGPCIAIHDLSKKFPNVKMEITYSDAETVTQNFTKYKFQNGRELYYEKHEKYDAEEIDRMMNSPQK